MTRNTLMIFLSVRPSLYKLSAVGHGGHCHTGKLGHVQGLWKTLFTFV